MQWLEKIFLFITLCFNFNCTENCQHFMRNPFRLKFNRSWCCCVLVWMNNLNSCASGFCGKDFIKLKTLEMAIRSKNIFLRVEGKEEDATSNKDDDIHSYIFVLSSSCLIMLHKIEMGDCVFRLWKHPIVIRHRCTSYFDSTKAYCGRFAVSLS